MIDDPYLSATLKVSEREYRLRDAAVQHGTRIHYEMAEAWPTVWFILARCHAIPGSEARPTRSALVPAALRVAVVGTCDNRNMRK